MAEARGRNEDTRLKKSYDRLFREGSHWGPGQAEGLSAQEFQRALTSKELKVKPKLKNIAGLQIADILAYPSKQQVLAEHELILKSQPTFGDRICQILEGSKYYRRETDGLIEGYGKKLLP